MGRIITRCFLKTLKGIGWRFAAGGGRNDTEGTEIELVCVPILDGAYESDEAVDGTFI